MEPQRAQAEPAVSSVGAGSVPPELREELHRALAKSEQPDLAGLAERHGATLGQAKLALREAHVLGAGLAEVLDVPDACWELGEFLCLRHLGAGGMGQVFEAVQASTGRRVALKLLPTLQRPDRERLERFRREGELAASITHPRCVFVFGADQVRGTPYIAMELMEGGTLHSLVRREGPLPIRQAVDFAMQLAEGLQAAADVGVVHRDVKPSNAFLDHEGQARIGDFGLSKSLGRVSELTASGSFLGTPHFASPEQVRSRPVDARSDIYSLAATLYFLLTGGPPHAGDSAGDVLAAIVADPPPSLRAERPDAPLALDRVLRRALAKDPAQRFADPAAFAHAIAPFGTQVVRVPSLGSRSLAWILDSTALSVPFLLLHSAGWLSLFSLYGELVFALAFFVYFALWEGLRGASPGKALLGLRVVRADGGPTDLGRSLVRAAAFVVLGWAPAWILSWWWSATAGPAGWFAGYSAGVIVGHVLWWSSLRRHNAWRTLHELLSGTRTTERAVGEVEAHAGAALWQPQVAAQPHWPRELGGFEIQGRLGSVPGGELALASDPRLDRRAVVLFWTRGERAPAAPREVEPRPARLRRLLAGVDGPWAWEAYEQPRGVTVPAYVEAHGPMAWSEARHHLASLASELERALLEGSLPDALELERVRLQPGGRIQLEDLLPGPREHDGEGPEQLLQRTAVALLGGQRSGSGQGLAELPMPSPVAERWTGLLANEVHPTSRLRALKELLGLARLGSAEMGRARRSGLMAVPAFYLAALLFTFAGKTWEALQPTAVEHLAVHILAVEAGQPASFAVGNLLEGEHGKSDAADRAAIYRTAARALLRECGPALLDGPCDSRSAGGTNDAAEESSERSSIPVTFTFSSFDWPTFTRAQRAELLASIDDPATEAPTAHLHAAPQPALAGNASEARVLLRAALIHRLAELGALAWWSFLVVGGLLSLLTAFFLRGGLCYRALGVAIHRIQGGRVSRSRATWRAALTWLPPLAFLPAAGMKPAPEDFYAALAGIQPWAWLTPSVAALIASVTLFAVGLLVALARPERGLSDRLAGTLLLRSDQI